MGSPFAIAVAALVFIIAAVAGVLWFRSRRGSSGGLEVSWRRTREIVRESGHAADGIHLIAHNTGGEQVSLIAVGFQIPNRQPVTFPWTHAHFPKRLAPGEQTMLFFSDRSLSDSIRTLGNPGQKLVLTPYYEDLQHRAYRGKPIPLTIVR